MKLINNMLNTLRRALFGVNRSTVAVAFVVLLIISLFIIPLPAPILDLLLVLNIFIALLLMVRSLFVRESLRLFSFPTILLLTTLYRLALNVSSTRLILLYGDQGSSAAGRVIESFGQFVVQGDFLVGAVIFVIIAVVNFVVIAKGSARVAEVSARFSLDAMPGRQLSIDADLRSGNITREQANHRRDELSRESQFFGAMDGAMKFVQGDAIAGLVITFINAVGGVSIGMSRGLSFSQAVDYFGILTVGDGLVSILPSLLISIAAGIIVTHVSGDNKGMSGEEIYEQLLSEPSSLTITAVALLILGLIPGFPLLPFLLVSVLLLTFVVRSQKNAKFISLHRVEGGLSGSIGIETRNRLGYNNQPSLPDGSENYALGGGSDSGVSLVRPLLLKLFGKELQKYLLLNSSNIEKFNQYYFELKRETFITRGISLPDISIAYSESGEEGYAVYVREQLVKKGTLDITKLFVSCDMATVQMLALEVKGIGVNPLDNSEAVWIDIHSQGRAALEKLGVQVLEPYQYLAQDVLGAALQVVEELFGLDEVKYLLRSIASQHQDLYNEVFSGGVITYPECADILGRLVKEKVNIRDLKLIVEGIAQFSSFSSGKDSRNDWLDDLHIFLRKKLSRSIISNSLHPSGRLRPFILSSQLEEEFRSAASLWDRFRGRPPVDPETEITLRENAKELFDPIIKRPSVPIVLLCSGDIRSAVQSFFEKDGRINSRLRTVSFEELTGGEEPEPVGILSS